MISSNRGRLFRAATHTGGKRDTDLRIGELGALLLESRLNEYFT
jgi:hypothetical protein